MENSIEVYKSIKGSDVSSELINQKRELIENIQKIEKSFNDCLSYYGEEKMKDDFLTSIDMTNRDYIDAIQNLNEESINVGISWLSGIVKYIRKAVLKHLPSYI